MPFIFLTFFFNFPAPTIYLHNGFVPISVYAAQLLHKAQPSSFMVALSTKVTLNALQFLFF